MATWVIGDVHGCADELARLVAKLALTRDDALVSVGDLFHRGPDPLGVMEILRAVRARFVLGNHELAVLRRVGLAPASVASEDRPPRRERFPAIDAEDLAGDGRTPCEIEPARRAEVVAFLQDHSGFVLRARDVAGAGSTPDGREWCVIHAGLAPGCSPEATSVRDLTSLRRLTGRGHPWWYEEYEGRELVLFGHTPSQIPRAHSRRGKLVALGLDTGCVYGGKLTAYSPEMDEFVSVAAERTYAAI